MFYCHSHTQAKMTDTIRAASRTSGHEGDRTSRCSTQPSESKTTLGAASADRNKLIVQREYRGTNYSRTRSGSQYKPADIEVGNYYLSDMDCAILIQFNFQFSDLTSGNRAHIKPCQIYIHAENTRTMSEETRGTNYRQRHQNGQE